jgi:hypothetical protein
MTQEESMTQPLVDPASTGLPVHKTPFLLEHIFFPDISGLPQRDNMLFNRGRWYVKAAGAHRPGKWLRDVILGRRFLVVGQMTDAELVALRGKYVLPAGWVVCTEAKTGITFYVHKGSGVTQRARPTMEQHLQAPTDPPQV